MSNQPIIFDLKYTPYKLKKGATKEEKAAHADERAFYDMTGEKNIYDYMTTESKCTGESKFTFFEYLQKSTRVFNQNGTIPQEEVDEMKARLKENKGHIWHGFISLNEEESPKIDTPEKCIDLVKRTFPSFLDEAHIGAKNVDLMCSLHLDRPHHLHIHFVFWEKEPRMKSKFGEEKQYRAKGKISERAIDNMFVRLGLYLDNDKSRLFKSRDRAIEELKQQTSVKVAMSNDEEIRKEILSLAKSLPAKGRLSYGSEDMKPYRAQVDKIVQLLINSDGKARRANARFYRMLEERRRKVAEICGQPFTFTEGLRPSEIAKRQADRYHHKINPENIEVIGKIEEDYKRRQGNLVINLAKFIKPEFYEKKGRKFKTDDTQLKRRLNIGRRNIKSACNKFFRSFGADSELIERDFSHRLQEIEEEIDRERKKRTGGGNCGGSSGETK